ncbi:MAG: hypothetical protein Q7S77_01075 [Candidatus Staskawiczbacteria bacterium]|nr:hypothetical protein [Candidatus Staskawiczbacteria bacterium]
MKIIDNFISRENRKYRFQLGKTIASSLAGFVSGVTIIFIAWYVISNLPL